MKPILLIDNYDSFTYNLKDYVLQHRVDCEVVRNDDSSLDQLDQSLYHGIIISPGPGRPEQAGKTMEVLERLTNKVPILGVCLGHQAIGIKYGADLVKTKPMHGKTSRIYLEPDPLWEDLPAKLEVMRYHSLVLDNVDESQLDVIAKTVEGTVMAIKHKLYPLHGVQFHPESILTEHGTVIVGNWLMMISRQQIETN